MGLPEVIIVGAGPAGLATAIALRLGGHEVRVLEKRHPPIDKACGEGLMPAGVARLRSLGALPEESVPLAGIRYVTASGQQVTAQFPEGHYGLGVRRLALHAALAARASELGVELHWGTHVTGFFGGGLRTSAGVQSAKWYVGADGLHSTLKDFVGRGAEVSAPVAGRVPHALLPKDVVGLLGRSAARAREALKCTAHAGSRPARYGIRQHFLIAPWSPYVEVYWHETCEAYVTPVGPRCVGIAFLSGERPASFPRLIAYFPELARRLNGATPTSEVRGGGPMWQPCARRVRDNVALVGDAAGYLDAITGEGLTLAFEDAHLLATALDKHAWSSYASASRRVRRLPETIIRALLMLQARPRLTARLLAALCASPSLFTHMIRMNCGLVSPWHVPLGGLLRAGVHIAVPRLGQPLGGNGGA